jgi:hypothetical protein
VAKQGLDVEAPDAVRLVRRVPCWQTIEFSATAPGIWVAKLTSGDLELASLRFEVRQS